MIKQKTAITIENEITSKDFIEEYREYIDFITPTIINPKDDVEFEGINKILITTNQPIVFDGHFAFFDSFVKDFEELANERLRYFLINKWDFDEAEKGFIKSHIMNEIFPNKMYPIPFLESIEDKSESAFGIYCNWGTGSKFNKFSGRSQVINNL